MFSYFTPCQGTPATELAGMRCVIAAYSLVYKHCRLVDINVQDHPVAVFFALMFGVDFFYRQGLTSAVV